MQLQAFAEKLPGFLEQAIFVGRFELQLRLLGPRAKISDVWAVAKIRSQAETPSDKVFGRIARSLLLVSRFVNRLEWRGGVEK